jgi:thiamine kinase
VPPDWALRQVPGLERDTTPRRVTRLGGGTVNEVFRVESPAGIYVLRLDGAAWRRPGVDRQRELVLHRAAAAAGVAPAIVYAAPERDGLLITPWQQGRNWDERDYTDVRSLQRLGERLYVLHRQDVPALQPFDPLAVGRGYVALVDASQAGEAAPLMRRLARLTEDLQATGAAPVVVHGDLWQGNIVDGERLWLIDWEYAQITEPLMDIAGLVAYYPAAGCHAGELMAAAGISPSARPMLAERVEIYRSLNWLWHLVRAEHTDPTGNAPARPAN